MPQGPIVICMEVLSVDVGVRNLAIAILRGDELVEVEVIDVVSENGKRYAKEVVPEDVVASLSRRENLRGCEVVLVERQPARARAMRAVQAVIESHFLTMAALGVPGCNVKRVIAFDAKAKLADTGKTMRGTKNYSKRKSASVEACLRYLEVTGQDTETLTRYKKKDDAADAIMQGLAFVGWSSRSTREECLGVDTAREESPEEEDLADMS